MLDIVKEYLLHIPFVRNMLIEMQTHTWVKAIKKKK